MIFLWMNICVVSQFDWFWTCVACRICFCFFVFFCFDLSWTWSTAAATNKTGEIIKFKCGIKCVSFLSFLLVVSNWLSMIETLTYLRMHPKFMTDCRLEIHRTKMNKFYWLKGSLIHCKLGSFFRRGLKIDKIEVKNGTWCKCK